jgi:hypothetical protein
VPRLAMPAAPASGHEHYGRGHPKRLHWSVREHAGRAGESPRRTAARQHALSPGVVGLDRVAFVLGIVASVLWCIERSIRRAIRPGGTAAWSDEETRICRMRFENR